MDQRPTKEPFSAKDNETGRWVGYIPDQERPRGGGEVGLFPCVVGVTRGSKCIEIRPQEKQVNYDVDDLCGEPNVSRRAQLSSRAATRR